MSGNESKLRCAVILTAIPVEYMAVRAYLQYPREEVHPQGTIYERGTFTSLHQVWDVVIGEVGMGGQRAAAEAERAISHFEPDVILFVGVAGGLKDVQLGDVVAATKVYGYESGKVEATGFKPRPSFGASSYRMEQRAKAEARKDDWLRRLPASPEMTPKVYVGPIAAGEKAVASSSSAVYHFLHEHYSDALAVEMEGHGFLQATHANPQVDALIIRGISDCLDDKGKADAANGQQIAAQHASAFAFEVLAKLDVQTWTTAHPTAARFGAPFPEIWNVPRRHKAFFTGREHVLKRLYDGFTVINEAGMISPQALDGLGGIGKTQTSAEYAFRYRADYRAVLWVRAASQEELLADYRSIARLLKRPEAHLGERDSLIQSMREWFMAQTQWLLVFDNADQFALVEPFLPTAARGHILLTTRAQATRSIAQQVALEQLDPDNGALCILRRAGLISWNGRLSDTTPARLTAAQTLSQLMDGLPLALEQAGAYMEDTGCGVLRYLDLYRQEMYRYQMLQQQGGPIPDYPTAVASAWTVSRQAVEQAHPAAADLLKLCAFLSPDAIPEEILTRGASVLGPVLGEVAAHPLAFNQALQVLRQYSLLTRDADRDTDIPQLSMHRIMQEVIQDEMDESTHRLWAERTVRAVALALPSLEWQVIQPHVRVCLHHIERWHMTFAEAEQLQQQARANQAH